MNPFIKDMIPAVRRHPVEFAILLYCSIIMPPVAKNMKAAGKATIIITGLGSGLFSRAVRIVMMEIIKNPMRVPNSTAHFDLTNIREVESLTNNIIANVFSIISSNFKINVGVLVSCDTSSILGK